MAKAKAPPHGTRARYYYRDGCRCEACRAANAAEQRHRRDGARHHSGGTVPVKDAKGNVVAQQPPLFGP